MAEAQRISDLLVMLNDAREWRETLSSDQSEFIGFENIVSADNVRLDGTRGGWQGELRMDRSTAVAMMKWLEAVTLAELSEHGVTDR